MKSPFDVLHIKQRTEGSSNELSFDVLDAASAGVDISEKRKPKTHSKDLVKKKASRSVYHGGTGTATFSAAPEVERRKKARRAHKLRLGIVTFVAIAALVGTGLFFGMRYYHDKVDFQGHFNSLIGEIVEVDKVIVQVDDLMADPLNKENLDQQDAAVKQFPQVKKTLEMVASEAKGMNSAAQTDKDRAALSSVDAAVEARMNMLSIAQEAFEKSKEANAIADEADRAWSEVMQADELARQASTAANSATTHDATNQARSQTASARELLLDARNRLETMSKSLGNNIFALEIEYLQKRTESLDQAIKTADELIAGHREEATQANDAYNVADKEAAELAQGLTVSPGDKVRTSFGDEMRDYKSSYDDVRSAAVVADAMIRSYL